MISSRLTAIYEEFYEQVAKPALFQMDAQAAHEWALQRLSKTDQFLLAARLAALVRELVLTQQPVTIGDVTLSQAAILAAGFVKGMGFANESNALKAVRDGQNIIPGWRTMPRLVGLVELGSFTRYPRLGNEGTVIWRHPADQSTQNRIGLKNPGAVAAAEFLGMHADELPRQYGINLAVSPGVVDPALEVAEIEASAEAFLNRGVRPTWFTLNISCPNTEDDPAGHQTHEKTEQLVQALVKVVRPTPVWIKIGPALGDVQYAALLAATAASGGQAIIATNTIGMPSPADDGNMAGVGGGQLYPHAYQAALALTKAKATQGVNVDIIACGGILSGTEWRAYADLGIKVMHYWSALIYRGPLAAALILNEAKG